jgi:hypothetical protein
MYATKIRIATYLGGKMNISNASASSDGGGSFVGKSGGLPEGAISGAGVEVGPKSEYSRQSKISQPGKSASPAPPPKDIVRVTLLIPEDEYKDWDSSKPASIRVIKFEILDDDERARYGY